MTKQEIIKEAWGDFYEKAKHAIDENGYFNRSKDRDLNLLSHFEVNEMQFIGLLIRPKSLQGIENNNDWICVENEKNLPEEMVWIYKNEEVILGTFFDLDGFPCNTLATHYQPIQKPKPPIY